MERSMKTSLFTQHDKIGSAHALRSVPIGFNFEFIVQNNLNQAVYIYSIDGSEMACVDPVDQKMLIGIPMEGVDIYYRSINGNRNDPKNPDKKQNVHIGNVRYDAIHQAPVLIRELNVYLALFDQKSQVPNFQENLRQMLTNRSSLGVGEEPYPYVVYANVSSGDSEYFYMSIDGVEIVRVPIIKSPFLKVGSIMFGRTIVRPDNSCQSRTIETTFEILQHDDDDVMCLDNLIVGSFNLTSVRRFLKMRKETEVIDPKTKVWSPAEENFIQYRIDKAVMAAIEEKDRAMLAQKSAWVEVNQDRAALENSLERAETERKRLERAVKQLENQLGEDQVHARRIEDEMLRRQRTKTESFKATATLMTTFVTTVTVLKQPLVTAAKWLISFIPRVSTAFA